MYCVVGADPVTSRVNSKPVEPVSLENKARTATAPHMLALGNSHLDTMARGICNADGHD